MTIKFLPTLCFLLAATCLSGCAAYPVVQVAGTAMTGYDVANMADDYLPRDNVQGGSLCVQQDKMLQRRLRERLQMNGLENVTAHVIDRHAYLLGRMKDHKQADYAVKTAATVQGLKAITSKFYPALPSNKAAIETARDELLYKKITKRFKGTKRLQGVDLRVEVIHSNAILVGKATTFDQKTAALAIAAEIGGVKNVTDYITVPPAPDCPPAENAKENS